MSYQMQLDAKSRNAGRFVRRVQKELQAALVRSGLRQQQVAERLGVDRSIVNRRLTGNANLTLRSISDLAFALEHDIVFSLRPKSVTVSSNEYADKIKPEAATLLSDDVTVNATVPWNSHVKIRGAAVSSPTPGLQSSNAVSKNMVRQHEGA